MSTLAQVFETDIQVLINGEINKNENEKDDMRKIGFYVCRKCGNIITATSEASITCCGNKLSSLEPRKAEECDMLKVEDVGGEWFIFSEHEMTKKHCISFVAYVSDSSVMMFQQYPEWNLQLTLPMYRTGRLVWYCTKCGLLYQDICRSANIKN